MMNQTMGLKRVVEVLEDEGIKGVYPPNLDSIPRDTSRIFLAFFAHSTRIRLFLTDRCVEEISLILSPHLIPSSTSLVIENCSDEGELPSPPRTHQKQVNINCVAEEIAPKVIGKIAKIGELNACRVNSSKTLMWEALLASLRTMSAFLSAEENKSVLLLELVVKYINASTKPFTPLRWGNVIHEQANAFKFASQFGAVQIGSPEETVKFSLLRGEDVPSVFILPSSFFNRGNNCAEIEFPIFFTAYAAKHKQRVVIVGTKEQMSRVRVALQESVLGPADLDSTIDISPSLQGSYYVDLRQECDLIAGRTGNNPQQFLESLVDLQEFDSNGSLKLTMKKSKLIQMSQNCWVNNESTSENTGNGELGIENIDGLLMFYEDGILKGIADSDFCSMDTIPDLLSPRSQIPLKPFTNTSFQPPSLGITFLGTSHGFDSHGRTTGFIIWIDGKGIVVDPPFFTLDYLRDSAVIGFIDSIILTHIHSDHDSGVLSMMFSSGHRMKFYTTQTIHNSWKRKWEAILGNEVGSSFDFIPVKIGQPIEINGANFEFQYAIHTIPTIGFQLWFGGKSISYSSDTRYDPSLLSELVHKKVISPARESALRMRGFDADLILHEMGVPPIHTDAFVLNNLPMAIKNRMLIVHCAGIPEYVQGNGSEKIQVVGLKKPPGEGLENTVVLDLETQTFDGYQKAKGRLKILCGIPFLHLLSPEELFSLFSSMTVQTVSPGDVVVQSGAQMDSLYLVEQGKLLIHFSDKDNHSHNNNETIALFSGDTFGQTAFVHPNHINPHALTAVVSSTLLRLSFSLLEPVKPVVERILNYRHLVQQSLELHSSYFNVLSKTQIELVAMAVYGERHYNPGEIIIQQGDTDRTLYIIKSGSVSIDWKKESASSSSSSTTSISPSTTPTIVEDCLRLGPSDCFGEIAFLQEGTTRQATVKAVEPTCVIAVKHATFEELSRRCPSIALALKELAYRRLEDQSRVAMLYDKLP